VRQKTCPNLFNLDRAGETWIEGKINKGKVGKNRGDNGGTFGEQRGSKDEDTTKCECLIASFSSGKKREKKVKHLQKRGEGEQEAANKTKERH
jgi:hypothetical protein